MDFVRGSMRRPITVMVAAAAVALGAFFGVEKMPRDILPNLGVPVIYVAQPYGGMSPAQMEGYLTYYYEYHFLYATGIEHVESKSIQGVALIKLQFHPGTDMAQAMAETINYANRARAFMPPGTVPPFVMRFDAGSVPVGDLVFESETKTVGQLQDLALNRVRPLFATLPGVSAPPPFGASQRTIVIRVDPAKLREFNLSPDNVAEAVSQANVISPAGNIRLGELYPMVPMNSVVADIRELENVPLRLGTYPTVFLRDVGTVEDATDIPTGFALVNGRRTVYIAVTKRADASTLSVVDLVRKNLPKFQSVLPEDVKVSFKFDQSGTVRRAIRSLVAEGCLGALLTGLMVLLFLRDWRSAGVVVANIPLALCGAVLGLWAAGQTVNVMTLGGLALAVGILVDEATVTIENIHTHLGGGKPLARASLDATVETILPRFLAMLCVLSVFIPSFFMTGAARALFVPLSLAVGFSMIGSYLLSSSFVPVLATWTLRGHPQERPSAGGFEAFRRRYRSLLESLLRRRAWVLAAYLLAAGSVLGLLGPRIGRELFPRVDAGQFQIRLRAATGTVIEGTEAVAKRVLELISAEAGADEVDTSIGFVGVQPPSFPVNTIHLWTSGPEEAVLQVALKRGADIDVEVLKERLRKRIPAELPRVRVSFEPSDIVGRVMSQGSPTPIEVAVSGPDFKADREYALKVREALSSIASLRDLQFGQSFDYPSVQVDMDRARGGVMGLSVAKVGRALTAATSSSRYVLPNYWADPKSGIAYQLQVEVPMRQMSSIEAVKDVPVNVGSGAVPLRRFSRVVSTTTVGEYDRFNMQRMVTLTANLSGEDLGHAAGRIAKALKGLEGSKPRNVTATVRGQIAPMEQMFDGLKAGLGLAVLVIFLLLAANFQSVKLSLIVLSTIPAVLAGVLLALAATQTTINVESFMGAIMAVGVAVANAILLVSFAERSREAGSPGQTAALEGAESRLRPILMTSLAMIAGMIPMTLGWGEGAQQTSPLGRAVIGGLAFATAATLLILPLVYAALERGPARRASLDPDERSGVHALGLVLLLGLAGREARAAELPLTDALVAAEKASPELKAASAREAQARDSVELGKSPYYPTLEAQGIQSYGFAGSNGALGLGGIMSSPFRSGPTGGLVSKLTLFDLSRGYGLRAERSRLEAAQAQTRVTRYALDQALLRIYFEGVRYRGQVDAWREIELQIEKVLKEVNHLVKTGQHSPVEQLLVKDQADDAAMAQAAFAERYKIALKRLALLTALPEGGLACPSPASLSEADLAGIRPGEASPAVERAQAEARAAKDAVGQRSAANYPVVTALGSAGGMDKVRLVNRVDYSAGFGVSLPIFEGFKISNETARAKDAAAESDFGVLAARLDLDESNAAYDEVVASSRVKLRFLEDELKQAERALDLAKQRYLSFEGPLVDVREAIRNLARIKTQQSDAKVDLLHALGAKAVLNGGHVEAR